MTFEAINVVGAPFFDSELLGQFMKSTLRDTQIQSAPLVSSFHGEVVAGMQKVVQSMKDSHFHFYERSVWAPETCGARALSKRNRVEAFDMVDATFLDFDLLFHFMEKGGSHSVSIHASENVEIR